MLDIRDMRILLIPLLVGIISSLMLVIRDTILKKIGNII